MASHLTNILLGSYPDYIDMLTKNERYILCCPPDQLTQSSCEVDPKLIQEHIIESLDENEFRSLAG